jgi:hypothetical protein
LVSQPLAALASQLAKPKLHVKPQLPATQVAVALARAGHALPQEPQLATSVFVLVSQPATWLSQSAKPATHVNPQIPPAHVLVALAIVGHATPQAPQLSTSVFVFVSQPLTSLASQLAKGASHVNPQFPATQVAVALAGA